jgi:hypothetical protein
MGSLQLSYAQPAKRQKTAAASSSQARPAPRAEPPSAFDFEY